MREIIENHMDRHERHATCTASPVSASKRRALYAVLLSVCPSLVFAGGQPKGQPNTDSHKGQNMGASGPSRDGIHDFDFLLGSWRVRNRRLRKRLQNSDDWEIFEAVQHNQALPGGIGNFDDFKAERWRPGFIGLSLRLFNPQTGLWSIYWLDNNTAGLDKRGILMPPVVGRFEDGVGVFEGDDELDGMPIRTRYTWSDVRTDHPRWEQAMSPDAGRTWEMNWSMRFERMA